MKIRKATISDANEIYEIENTEFKFDYYSLSEIKNCLFDNNSINFVLFLDNKIIGYILASFLFKEATILKISIHCNYQSKGYGKILLSHFIDYLKNKNCEKIFIEVSDKNIRAINFYQSFGFTKTRIRQSYYKDKSNALEMIKIL